MVRWVDEDEDEDEVRDLLAEEFDASIFDPYTKQKQAQETQMIVTSHYQTTFMSASGHESYVPIYVPVDIASLHRSCRNDLTNGSAGSKILQTINNE